MSNWKKIKLRPILKLVDDSFSVDILQKIYGNDCENIIKPAFWTSVNSMYFAEEKRLPQVFYWTFKWINIFHISHWSCNSPCILFASRSIPINLQNKIDFKLTNQNVVTKLKSKVNMFLKGWTCFSFGYL